MKQSKVKFEFTDGAHIRGTPSLVGKALTRLERNGRLSPEALVAAAKDADHPCHDDIWGVPDKDAAMLYRLDRARLIIRSVRIVRDHEESVHAYYHIVTDGDNGYISRNAVLTDAEMHQKLLDEAIRTLKSFEARYKEIKELKPVLRAIRSLGTKILS